MAPAARSARRGNSMVVRVGAALAAVALLAGLLLTFIGGSKATTTTSTGADPATSAPPATMADAEYGRIIESTHAVITSAGTDRCELTIAFSQLGSQLAAPANPAQTRLAVQLTTDLLNAAATIAEGSGPGGADPTTAQALREAATAFAGEAQQEGYDPAIFNSTNGAAAFSTPAFTTAYSAYRAKDSEVCEAGGPTGPP